MTVIDEYSRFPFVFPCSNTSSQTVIKCLNQLFSLCGLPSYIHSDRGASFLSREIKEYLSEKGIATSKTTPYHPMGNGQCERYNGIVWKSIRLALMTLSLPETQWEMVLPDALHSIRSLLSTSTNSTPHERFFTFQRRSTRGTSLPSWLSVPGPVMLRRFVRNNKNDPLVDEVLLTDVNPTYAHIRYPDGRESTVSLKDLAPCPILHPELTPCQSNEQSITVNANDILHSPPDDTHAPCVEQSSVNSTPTPTSESDIAPQPELRRSTRTIRAPDRLTY